MGERAGDLVVESDAGLSCPAGGFYIDPWRPVPTAVITHAHADHARAGSGVYYATPETCDLLRVRLGQDTPVRPLEPGSPIDLGGARVSLHPAGHVLGSAQVRVEHAGRVWVVTGDYATAPNPTCAPFAPIPCDGFITESTFALPIYRWPDAEREFARLNDWWRANAAAGRTSLVLAYSLGKAQRVLAALDRSIGPIGVHGAIPPINAVYQRHGVDLPACLHATKDTAPELRATGVIVAPPSAAEGPWARTFRADEGMRSAMVSGWMALRGRRRWRSLDAGFVVSDHADWPGLLETIRATGATRVGATHGSTGALSRYCREQLGVDGYEPRPASGFQRADDERGGDPDTESVNDPANNPDSAPESAPDGAPA